VKMTEMPDMMVKHHWSKGKEVETKDNVYQTWSECRFAGDDIVALKAKDMKDCLDKCDMELFCRHVTLAGEECMLKGHGVTGFEMVDGRTDIQAGQVVRNKKRDVTKFVRDNANANGDGDDLREDWLVGKHYDEGNEYEGGFYRYHVWHHFDLWGGDLSSKSTELEEYTLDSCLEACSKEDKCKFAVTVPGKECWLKGQPHQLSRALDDTSEVIAAMRLGRVGKAGMDASTTKKRNSRPDYYDEFVTGVMAAGGKANARTLLVSPERSVSNHRILGVCGVVLLAGAGLYYQQTKFSYANELATGF